MNKTTHLELGKPLGTEAPDISVINTNMDTIDGEIYELQAAIGAANGIAELDANGKVPSSQLPSYVDDVVEYAALANFPATGETGKIYVATGTNLTYRWSGSAYVEISPTIALGETSTTAYRGDRGAAAYTHAVTNKGSAFSSGMYKITTNSEGHVTAASAVAKSDLTGLGVADATNPTLTGTVTLGETTLTEAQLQALLATAYHTITFVKAEEDGGGTLQTSTMTYGETPSYSGTPTTTRSGYTFVGWDPEISVVTVDQVYTAVFEQELVIPYLTNTMTTLDADYIDVIGAHAFDGITTLTSVTTNASTIESAAFTGCTGLTEIVLTKKTATTLESTDALPVTFFGADSERAIYVPDRLLDTYQEASNWSSFSDMIYPVSERPIEDFSTVSDSWAQIAAAAADGTHATKYEKGTSIKKLTYGTYTVYMQYIGDRDEGPVWAVKNFAETKRFHSAMTKYDGSEIDTYVNETVLGQLPSELQTAIKNVSITYYNGMDASQEIISRKVWLLSSREVGFTGLDQKETSGYIFSDMFTDNASRIKRNKNTGSASSWWTRSSNSSANPMNVHYNGIATNGTATNTWGVVFGFCLSGPSN